MRSHVRPASESDLDRLAAIEAAADQLFKPLFGAPGWGAPPAGQARIDEPGFVLVATEEDDGQPVGFVHVIQHDDSAHIEQLSVLPDHTRRGHGRALLDAAIDEAAEHGARVVTLRTYADVPWNAPFYASVGFEERPIPDSDFQRALTDAEQRLDLARHGRRVHMQLRLGMEMDAEAFEQLVIDELDRLPDDMVDGLENVVFVVEDAPEDGEELFGLYEGFALTERGAYGLGELPDRIVLYRHTHLGACRNEEELREEIHTTLVHEIAHFYGIDDARLHELGWA